MLFKKPRQQLFTLTSLSFSSICHLRAAGANITGYEGFEGEGRAENVAEKVVHQLSLDLRSH